MNKYKLLYVKVAWKEYTEELYKKDLNDQYNKMM